MNTSEIEVLLEKYYEGNSSLAEEQLLREFFGGKEIPAHLKSHQPLCVFFADEKLTEMAVSDFEKDMTAQLAEFTPEILTVPMHRNRGRFLFITGIAATILLLIGIFFTFQQDVFKTVRSHGSNYKTELAYAEASEALLIVSSNLNTGLKQVSRLQVIDKAMKNMYQFNKFYQYQTIIINPDDFQNQSTKTK